MSDSQGRSLLSASAVMAAGTALSRVLGFVRAILIAFVLGNTTRQVDMFNIANTIPTSLYILFAGGALNTVLVPQIVRATKNDPDHGEAYTNRIMTAFLAIVAVITLLVTLGAPWIVRLYSADSWRDAALSAQYESMVTLAYLCLPQIFFYGAFFLAGQVLNARGRFGPMMWAPIANNLVSILIFVGYLLVWGNSGDHGAPFTGAQQLLLGGGATLGIVVQTAVLLPYLRAAGFRYRPRFDFRHTGLGHTFGLAKWTLGFVAVNQVALVVVNRLASSATTATGAGAGLTVYNNAYLLWVLPHSLITISLATAMLPSASRLAAEGDLSGVRRETVRTIKLATTLLLPAAVAFIVLAHPIARLAFGNGGGSDDYQSIAWALMAFAIGLVPFTVQYVLLRAFYALEDTRSTFWLQCVIAVVNAGLAVAFVLPVGRPELVAAGLALAYSLSYVIGVLTSFRALRRRLPDLAGGVIVRHLVRVAIAIAPGALAAWGITRAFDGVADNAALLGLSLVLAAVAAIGLFVLVGRLLHIGEVTDMLQLLRGRRGRSAGGETAVDPDTEDTLTSGAVAGEAQAPDAHSSDTQAYDPFADTIVPSVAAASPELAPAGVPAPPAEDDDTIVRPFAPLGGERPPVNLSESTVHAGQVLAGRYRLEEVIAGRANTYTWRAFDQVLSRAVLCHVLPPHDPRTPDLLEAARKSAVATDSRFLRVLDAVHSDDPELGSYIICEYAPGLNVEVLLGQGPLSSLEAAWLIRELADALSAMHAQGLYHRRINPDTVVITRAGNVKLVGFLLEAAMFPEPDAEPEDPEAVDVRDLGRMLYASLVSRWPGEAAYGMPRAPQEGGRLLTPRQVRAGVSPALDQITDQILGAPPRAGEPPLRTANEVVNALSMVLGSADASQDLERRLRSPQAPPPVSATQTIALSRAAASTPASPLSPAAASRTEVSAPVPPARSNRRWLLALTGLLVVALIIGLTAVALTRNRDGAGSPADPSVSSSAPAGPIKIVSATEFDPQGDDGQENHADVPKAIDGDPATAWSTVNYRGSPQFGNLKRGVGLILDLGSPQSVRQVNLQLARSGQTRLRIMVPQQADATSAPMSSDGEWRNVSRQASYGRTASVQLTEPTTTRFVMVYLTSLPPSGNSYRGSIYEAEVVS